MSENFGQKPSNNFSREQYPNGAVGRGASLSKTEIAKKAAGVIAALGVVGGLTGAIAKGIHDEQSELAARVDYGAANKLQEERQKEVHTKYFKKRREDDGYSHADGKKIEVYNRINPQKDKDLVILSEPSQGSDRIEGFAPKTEYDGSILGVPVYGDPFLTNDGKGSYSVLLNQGDNSVDKVGYYQKVRGIVNGKETEGYLIENSSLDVVKSIKDPRRNQGVIKVDLTKK